MTDRLAQPTAPRHEPASAAPSDAERVLDALADILDGKTRFVPDLDLNGSSAQFGKVADSLLELVGTFSDHQSDLTLASAAIEQAAIAMLVLSRDGRFRSVNDEACRRTGFSHEEYPTMHIWDTTPAFTLERLNREWQTYDAAAPPRFETMVRRKDGSEVPVELAIRLMDFHDEQYLVVFASDVSDRKHAEQALRDSEQKFAHAFHGNPVSMSIVDSDGFYIELNRAWEQYTGYTRAETIGRHMAELPQWDDATDLVVAMSTFVEMGHVDGLEVSFLTKADEHRVGTLTAEVLEIAGHGCILSTMQDITARKHAEEERLASAMRLEVLTHQTIATMASLVEARDPYTAGHQRRVASLSAAIGAELGFDKQTIAGLRVAAQLHDIGKMTVPAEILAKPGKLSYAEFALVKGHVEAGANMLSSIDFPWPVAQIVLQHHERLDGSGYPRGIAGDEILMEARVLAVADVVEAMSAHRPYRASLGLGAALAEIERGSATLYDADAVNACISVFAHNEFSFE